MRQLIIYMLLVFFALLGLGSCTNHETDENLEILTPNEPTETGVQPSVQIPEQEYPG